MIGRTAEQVRADVCGSKIGHATPGAARAHLERLRRRNPNAVLGHYRCPFCSLWHVGHVPSLASLETLARVMRGLDPTELPAPHDPPAKRRRRRKEKTG